MGTCVEFEQELANASTGDGIQVTRGLVGKQNRRLSNERTRKRDALLFAARQLPRIVPCAGSQPDALERVQSRAASLGATRQFQRKHDVFEGSEGRDEVKRLEHEPDALRSEAGTAIFVQSCEVLTLEQHAPAAGQIQASQQRKQRRFARS
jgi:hypothetical protein